MQRCPMLFNSATGSRVTNVAPAKSPSHENERNYFLSLSLHLSSIFVACNIENELQAAPKKAAMHGCDREVASGGGGGSRSLLYTRAVGGAAVFEVCLAIFLFLFLFRNNYALKRSCYHAKTPPFCAATRTTSPFYPRRSFTFSKIVKMAPAASSGNLVTTASRALHILQPNFVARFSLG